MSFPANNYYYNAQIKSYVLQFMAIFTGLQVQVGKWGSGVMVAEPAPTCDDPDATIQVEEVRPERLISVPIHYGHADRIVSAILANNTQNKPIRLPVMSATIRNLSIATDRFTGTGTERRSTFTPVGGLVPDDTRVIHQKRPVPYDLDMELAIYASNTEQHFQILEQILLMFDPKLLIQTNDAEFDWTRITQVSLTDVNLNVNYPIGTERRIIQSELTFKLPVWISAPAEVKRDFIEKIYMRVGAVGTAAQSNYDMINELDDSGALYELVSSVDELDFS